VFCVSENPLSGDFTLEKRICIWSGSGIWKSRGQFMASGSGNLYLNRILPDSTNGLWILASGGYLNRPLIGMPCLLRRRCPAVSLCFVPFCVVRSAKVFRRSNSLLNSDVNISLAAKLKLCWFIWVLWSLVIVAAGKRTKKSNRIDEDVRMFMAFQLLGKCSAHSIIIHKLGAPLLQ